MGILLVKPGDAETCAKLESAESLRAYFDEDFPMFSPYVSDEDLAAMAARPLAKLPTFSHAGAETCIASIPWARTPRAPPTRWAVRVSWAAAFTPSSPTSGWA